MAQTLAIDFDDVWFSYNGFAVLREVSLHIPPHELVSVVGPNGGGKTTLLRLMLGLIQPDRGRVRILGCSPLQARPRVGYTPQYTLFDPTFPVSAMDVVLMGRLGRSGLLGRYTRQDRQAAEQSLGEVGMADLRRRAFSELSGGQRQRVLIARALTSGPELLLLDEPTSNLDVSVEGEVYDLLASLSKRMTIVVVSHDMGFVAEQGGIVVCVKGTVAVHPTAGLTGEVMRDLYGRDVRLVRHDHDCQTECPGGQGAGEHE
jgi:zinc transport system ATP-binding protein